jgi:DNA-binding response OmpR family regulator
MSRNTRILVVEDDEAIRTGLVDALSAAGYESLSAADGKAGLRSALADELDLVLLDLMLPGKTGLDVLAELRVAKPLLPVIILTAVGDEDTRVAGLEGGADDYVVKPFSVRELLARIESVLRRSPGRADPQPMFPVPGGTADADAGEIRFDDGSTVALSDQEVKLLRYFGAHPNRPLSRDEILLHVWHTRPEGIETRTIDMHVARLRQKLGDSDPEPRILRTIRGKGYVFDPSGGG